MKQKYRLGACGLILILFCLANCSAQKETLSLIGFSKDQMRYEDGSEEIDSLRLINRVNEKAVRISFYEEFEDSIVLYINNRQIWTGTIYKKNNPYTSTGWCGFDLNFTLNRKNNVATIKLINQKEYVQFRMNPNLPLYVIQRYNKIWTVRSLKSELNSK